MAGTGKHVALSVCFRTVIVAVLLSAPRPVPALTLAMTPSQQNVAPGAGFDIQFNVVAADSMFNGFDANVVFDPAALTLVPASPISLQEGCLMTGVCSAACGNTFHVFTPAADSLSVTDVLLCAGVALQGPGTVYTLHFVASNTPQLTSVHFHRVRFFNAGMPVANVQALDDTIAIGVQLGVPTAPGHGLLPRVKVAPNPARGAAFIRVDDPAGGVEELFVSDVAGRAVRVLQRGRFDPGARSVTWDGRDDAGRAVPAGVYFVRFRAAGQLFHDRLVLLR